MLISSRLSKLSQRYGITDIKDFYALLVIVIFANGMVTFTSTYINLDIHSLIKFKGDRASWDFMMPYGGALMSAFLFPKIQKMLTSRALVSISFLGIIGFYILLIFFITTDFNYPFRWIIGFSYGNIFISIACLGGRLFNPPYRATLFAVLGTLSALSEAFGAALVKFFQQPFEVFGIASVSILVSLIFFLNLTKTKKEARSQRKIKSDDFMVSHNSFYRILALSPLVFISIFMMGCLEGGIYTYLTIYSEGTGLNEGNAALVYSASSLGSIVFLPLMGRLGDKWGYHKVFILTISTGLLGIIGAFFLKGFFALAMIFFVINGSILSFWSLMQGWISTNYKGKNLFYGMSAFSSMKFISYILAPLGVGFLMQTFGNVAFLYWLLISAFIALILILFQMKKMLKP